MPEVSAKCGGKNRNGTLCKREEGWGTPSTFGRCSYHGGATPNGLKHAATLEAEAMSRRVMGAPIRMEPEDALQYCIDVTAGEAAYCDLRIEEIREAEAAAPITGERIHEELDKGGTVHELREHTAQSTAQLHVWVVTKQGCIDRLARYSKMALDAGIEERRAQLDERQSDLIAGAVLAVVAQLESLSDEDRARVRPLLQEHVERHAAPVIEGTVAA
jgi:hypothetical protein